MGSPQRNWREEQYGPERARSLRSRLFVLLRDELGLGRQPKVARLLVDEIVAVVDSTLVDGSRVKPGQVHVLAPELGQGPSWSLRKLEDKRMKAVTLTLVAEEDIERLVFPRSCPRRPCGTPGGAGPARGGCCSPAPGSGGGRVAARPGGWRAE